jgi:hypothetical protein
VEKKVVEPLRRGEAIDLPLPEGAQQKRLGEYRKLSDGRLRLDLNDKESLNGLMILRPKKDARDVWIGTYQEKKDGKVVGEWNIEVRPIED